MTKDAQLRSTNLSVDRVEDDWAVLLTDQGNTFDVPRSLLPPEAVEGSRLICSMTLQDHASSSTKATIRAQLHKLTEGDDGEDIVL